MRRRFSYIVAMWALLIGSIMIMNIGSVKAQACNVRVTFIDRSSFPQVHVNVSVTDSQNNPILNLTSNSFTVTENGQIVNATTTGDSVPFTAILVVDLSGSMDGTKLAQARSAATDFINRMRAGDQVGILPFADSVGRLTGPTDNQSILTNTINSFSAGGGTRFYDTVVAAINSLENVSGRRVVIAMTDGQDTGSGTSIETVIALATDEGIDVHTIGFGQNSSDLDQTGLQNLAAGSNGLYYRAGGSFSIEQIYAQIAQQLSSEYVLEYTSPNPNRNAQERRVEVDTDCNSIQVLAGGRYNPGNPIPGATSGDQNQWWLIPLFAGLIAGVLVLLFVPRFLDSNRMATSGAKIKKPSGSTYIRSSDKKQSHGSGLIKIKKKDDKPPPNVTRK